jgi:hypothetical protein
MMNTTLIDSWKQHLCYRPNQRNRPAQLCCPSLFLEGQDEKLPLVIYGQA